MMASLYRQWQNRLQQWIARRHPAANFHRLHARQLYILPSSFGWLFAAALLGVFIGAINYQVSALFLLTFILAVCAMISAWQAHANLQGLSVESLVLDDCATGTSPIVKLHCDPHKIPRFAIELGWYNQPVVKNIPFLVSEQTIALDGPVRERGIHSLPRLYLQTRYPFGLFTVWTWLTFKQQYAVYPKPFDPGYWPATTNSPDHSRTPSASEDELYELRQVDDPWSHRSRVAWKVVARREEWFVKILQGTQGRQWIFRLQDAVGEDREKRLQILSYWLIRAEQQGLEYALQMNNDPANPHRGEQHLRHCLWALADWQ